MSLKLFSWLLAFSTITSLSLALFAMSRRKVMGTLPFALMLFGEFIWGAGYWWELRTPDLEGKLFWDNMQFLGTDIAMAGALLFALIYTGHSAWTRRYGPFLAIFPACSLLIVWSRPLQQLVRTNPQIVIADGQAFLTYDYGLWFWAFVGYSYALTTITIGLLIVFAIQLPGYRQQTLAFVVGFSAPAIGSLLTVLGLIPIRGLERLDISAITFIFTLPPMTWALFRKHMLDIVPIARTLLVDQMSDAVLVLDMQHRVVDANARACQLLEQQVGTLIGAPISTPLPELGRLLAESDSNRVAELRLPQQSLYDFEVAINTLHNRRHRRIGWLAVLRDITVQKQQVRYQRAVADCGQILLRAGHDAAESGRALDHVLGQLREAARVQRIDICRATFTADGLIHTSLLADEHAAEIAPLPLVGCLPWTQIPATCAALRRGPVYGPVARIFAAAPDLIHTLETDGVHAILLLPLSDANGLWGILSADAGRPDYLWDTSTLTFLSTAAGMIAVSMHQWQPQRP
ncbi:MAG: PAS domain-containing protein [Blastochloris sp.]|nr:PAS domain-containing protein [Blastochloris sp.]